MSTATATTVTASAATPTPPPSGQPPRLRRMPVPVAQPRPALRVVRDEPHDVPPTQGTLALALSPVGVADGPARDDATSSLSGSGTLSGSGSFSAGGTLSATNEPGPEDDFSARRRTSGHVLPEPRAWARQFIQAAVEVTTGLRPASQLRRWTSDEVQSMLTRRANLTRRVAQQERRPRRSVVRSTHLCILRDGVAEVSAVVDDGHRVRAVALRLEGLDGRWRVTALQIG